MCRPTLFYCYCLCFCIFETQCFIFDVRHLSWPASLIMMYHGARVVTATISQGDNNKCLLIAFPDIFLERENFGKYCDSLPLLNSAITNAVVIVTRAFSSHSYSSHLNIYLHSNQNTKKIREHFNTESLHTPGATLSAVVQQWEWESVVNIFWSPREWEMQ